MHCALHPLSATWDWKSPTHPSQLSPADTWRLPHTRTSKPLRCRVLRISIWAQHENVAASVAETPRQVGSYCAFPERK